MKLLEALIIIALIILFIVIMVFLFVASDASELSRQIHML